LSKRIIWFDLSPVDDLVSQSNLVYFLVSQKDLNSVRSIMDWRVKRVGLEFHLIKNNIFYFKLNSNYNSN